MSLAFIIPDKAVLHATYIPFVKQGGIFIPTNKIYKLGEKVQLALHLLDETDCFSVSGKVIWITPSGAQGNRAPGVGIQFQGEEGVVLKNKIEMYLTGALKSEHPTYTM